MAKPNYFYGIHAIDALLEHRPLDALSLFVQQGRESDSHVAAIMASAQDNGVSIQPTQKDKLTQLCGSPQHQGVVLHARPLAFADEAVLDTVIAQESCLLLVLDQITDAHNFGACLRTAVAMALEPLARAATIPPMAVDARTVVAKALSSAALVRTVPVLVTWS